MIAEIEPRVSTTIVRSLSGSQAEILSSIERLYCPTGFECDATFGNGTFWKGRTAPKLLYDLEPLASGVIEADCRHLPVEAGSLNNLVIDLPFLTYVRTNRTGNGTMRLARRFSGFWRYDELEDHYRDTISEAYRVLVDGGILVFKCQDIIHNHRMHCTHHRVINMAEVEGFRLEDLFILSAQHRMPSPNRNGRQRHARIFHSYFLVFAK